MSKPWFYAGQAMSFPQGVQTKLGSYVYVLCDPRDKKVFYVGKAGGKDSKGNERLFDHFDKADKVAKEISTNGYNQQIDPKTSRILEIWGTDQAVDWYIIRHGLKTQDEAWHVEAALIDALSVSQNGPTLNIQGGHNAYQHGILTPASASKYGAGPVNPANPYRPVFIFPIQAALARGETPYDATRKAWSISKEFIEVNDAIAVGIADRISEGVFQVVNWQKWANQPANTSRQLWEFNGHELKKHELLHKDFTNIISRAMGYWQRGNHLIVEFDGKGKFRFLRGSLDKTTWFDL